MSSLSEQDPLNPNDPSYHAPRRLRERAKVGLSPLHETIPEPVRGPIATPASLDIQLKNAIQLKKAVSNSWNSLDPEVIHQPAGLARELDRGAALRSVAARFAAAAGVVTVVALFFFIMVPASRQSKPMVPASQQSDASSTSSEITGSMRTALPQSGEGDGGSKPMMPASRQSNAGSTSSEITGSVRTALPQSGGRRRRIETPGACFTAVERRFNHFRNHRIGENRCASIRPTRRRIEARACRISSHPRAGPG